jgi:hypothetical protein
VDWTVGDAQPSILPHFMASPRISVVLPVPSEDLDIADCLRRLWKALATLRLHLGAAVQLGLLFHLEMVDARRRH